MKTNQHATVFVNPTAGKGRSVPVVPEVRNIFERAGWAADVVETGSVQELERGGHAAIKNGSSLLVALGGDGTFQGLANAAYGADVILGILPGGGGNDFADALGLPQDAVLAAKAMLAGQVRWVDLARARTADGRERLYMGGGGLGIDAEAAQFANSRYREVAGRRRYMVSAVRALCSYRALEIRAEFPGTELPAVQRKVLLASVLNTPSYGAGIRLAPEAEVDDGLLDLVLVENRNVLSALTLLPRLMTTGELRARRMERVRVQRVRLTADRAAEFHGDGEILGPAPVEIEVLPRAVRILAPRRVSEPAPRP